jgi:hypothetical protein
LYFSKGESSVVKTLENFAELFPGDVEHLHGNLYRVRRNIIQMAANGLEVDDGRIKFGNPRWTKDKNGKLIARALSGTNADMAKMDELRQSIVEEGLENPLRLRVTDGDDGPILELVNGERRYRSIDLACGEDILCFDPSTEVEAPASQVYEWVDCRINRMDDKTAVRNSLRPNETGEGIGEGASVAVVKTLRFAGYEDDEIKQMTGKSTTWLRETDELLTLDEATFAALNNEEINRKVALNLARIRDVHSRLNRLEDVRQNLLARVEKKRQMIDESVEEDDAEIEIAGAVRRIAEMDGNQEVAAKAEKKVIEAKKRKKKKVEEGKSLDNAFATSKDWDATAPNSESKPWTINKIEKHWYTPLLAIIRRKGKDEEGNDLGIDLIDAKLVWRVLEAILEGKKEADGRTPLAIWRILREHNRKKSD